MLIPSIDLMGGRAVQLIGGRELALERTDVIELARRFRVYGEIAVIDLDAAMGRGDNLDLVRRLCREADCRVGGGIRDEQRAGQLLRAGANRLIVGTAAEPALLDRLPRERVLVAVDHRHGQVVDQGWQADTGEGVRQRIQRLAPHCGGFLVTGVHHEGRMAGFDPAEVEELARLAGRPLTYAGGVTTAEEVAQLDRAGIDAQVGMALYTGRLDPTDCFLACCDFERGQGRLPCIVQDEAGRTRMLAWQTPASLRQALDSGRGAYFSRKRNALWVKGETTGHTQELRRTDLDCDRDTIRFTVRQTGPTCHTGQATCFGGLDFQLTDLAAVIRQRLAEAPPGSYTARLASEPGLLAAKLREEVEEVIEAAGRPDDLVWECADLLYFLLVGMTVGGVDLSQVRRELERRRNPCSRS